MSLKYYVDTNFILKNPNSVNKYHMIVSSHVSREFESLELKGNDLLKFQIRQAKKAIKNCETISFDSKDYQVTFSDGLDGNYTDNKLLQACLDNNCGLATNDVLLQIKAKTYGIPLLTEDDVDFEDEEYTGVKELFLNPYDQIDSEILYNIQKNPEINHLDLKKNQYLVLWDITKPTFDEDGNVNGYKPLLNQYRFDGEKVVKIKYHEVRNTFADGIKPLNIKQKLAFDMMQNKNITVKALFGGFGVGKDFTMISHAINEVLDPSSPIDKILWVRNNVEVKDTNPIGFLPDGMQDKLLPFVMPLADHLGGVESLNEFISDRHIEVQHLGFMRGRDIKNTIIYVTECENNTKEHIQLLIGRVGEGSQLWLNGDTKQVDNDKFKANSGLNALKKLGGNIRYGQVTLDKVERSETARLADLLD